MSFVSYAPATGFGEQPDPTGFGQPFTIYGLTANEKLWRYALDRARLYDVIAVAAAGNDSKYVLKLPQGQDAINNLRTNNTGVLALPSGFYNVLSVGASDTTRRRWNDPDAGSNYGSGVDVWATGSNVFVGPSPLDPCYSNNQCAFTPASSLAHGLQRGSSLAAPTVAGVVALIRQVNYNASQQTIIDVLRSSAYASTTDPIVNRLVNGRQALIKLGFNVNQTGTITSQSPVPTISDSSSTDISTPLGGY